MLKGRVAIIKISIITCFLAFLFIISGYFFLTAYNDYRISHKEFTVLEGRKRLVKREIKEFERKKQTLKRLNDFMARINNLRLKKNKWDIFSVNLKDKNVSFPELERILFLTDNSDLYYFKPSFLHIEINKKKKRMVESAKVSVNGNNSKLSRSPSLTSKSIHTNIHKINSADLPVAAVAENSMNSKNYGDVIISLKGSFLIRKR